VLAVLDHRQFGRAFVLSIGEAGHEATTAPVSSGAGWRSPASGARSNAGQRNGCRSVVPWPGQALGVRAIRGCRWRGPCWQRSITGGSVGLSSSRSVKPAKKRRRRQCRAVPSGDRRQVGQVEGETAYRLPIGVAVAWSGSRGAGNPRLPLAWPVLAALDHRQFGRAFVLSIGEAGHEATTAPGSSGAGWRSPASGPGRTRDSATAADRGCRGVGRISGCLQASVADVRQGCRRRGSCWQRSTIGSSVGPSFSRSVKPATKRRQRQRRAVLGGDRRQVVTRRTRDSAPAADRGCRGLWSGCRAAGSGPSSAHRQFGRAFVLSIGEAGHEATTAPVSSGAWWRSPASGPGRRRDSVPAADRGCRGVVRLSGCWQCSITGSSVGPSFSRSVKPATRRRRRQCRAVPGGDRRQVVPGEGETAYRLPIGRAVAWSGSRGASNPRLPLAWPVLAALDHRQFGRAFVLSIGEAGHEATTAPASSGAGWRSPASGPGRRRDSVPAADRSCRGLVRLSGCGQSAVAAGVARAGSARSSAVRSVLRPLDR
jgi:hypothetical protein